MTDAERISLAVEFMAKKHARQIRKDGSPYVWHPAKVALSVKAAGYGTDHQIAALLHDVIEDAGVTREEIEEMFGANVAQAVILLTRINEQKESDYIAAILGNEIASAVKNADRIDNLTDAACTGTPGAGRENKSQKFLERYVKESQEYYQGKFSPALDKVILKASQACDGIIRNPEDFRFSWEQMRLYS